MTEEEWRLRTNAERARLDREHNVIDDVRKLDGWTLISLERWKPGVVRFTAERSKEGGRERQIGFAGDNIFVRYQLPP